MINFMHQTGECRWNQPLVTDQPMIFKLGACTFPSPSQRSNPSLRQISLKNTHSHHRLPTHQHRQDYQINPTTPDPKRQSNLIRFSAVDYVCITREGERRTERDSFIPTEAKKEYQYKYSSGLSVSEEISELAISKKEKISSCFIDKNQLFSDSGNRSVPHTNY